MRFLWVHAFLVICLWGCGDEGVENVLNPLDAPAAPDGVNAVTGVPPHVAAFLWDKFGTREELIARLVDLEQDDDNWEFYVDWLVRVIATMDRNRIYYSRYINAGGVAVVGHLHVPDAFFIAARNIILTMTSKHPEIRERLFPRNSGFHIALLPSHGYSRELPHTLWSSNATHADGKCSGGLCWSTVRYEADGRQLSMSAFVHEFAHAMERVITRTVRTRTDPVELLPPLDPTFEDRLKHAYDTAKAAGKWRSQEVAIIGGKVVEVEGQPLYIIRKDYQEYWAEGVVCWYYLELSGIRFASREEFAKYDPLLYALLSEWLHEGSFAGRYGVGR